MNYEQTIEYLYNLQPIGIKFGLNNTLALLHSLGNPHQKIKTIHVAGTNGKGSVCAMLSAILQTAGYKVGLYTSPHLIDFTERISINHQQIGKPDVVQITERVKEAIRQGDFSSGHPTFFEVVTVMAFLYFAIQQVDIAIMEVGMGGRLDATNVIHPLLGIITTIDFDHQQYLGNSIVEIAREKAGIIKDGMPMVVGHCPGEAMEVFAETCAEKKAFLVPVPALSQTKPLHRDLYGQRFQLSGPDSSSQQYALSLIGQHQIHNALVAITAADKLSELLPFPLSSDQITEGLAKAKWPGRLEVYQGCPPIIVDGAHNPAAANQLSLFLRDLSLADLILVIGIMKDKEIDKICQALLPLASGLILTRPDTERAAQPEDIYMIANLLGLTNHLKGISITRTIKEAIALAKTQAKTQDLICITGSLYTVGEAKVILDAR